MGKLLPLFNAEYNLVRAINRGDEKACKLFYEKYAARFLGICCRYINDRMAAEDVMVESMMKIFEKSKQFNFKGSFEGWCKRLVVNQALIYLRSQKTRLFDLDEVTGVGSDSHLSFEENDILQLLSALPSGYRTVFNLYVIEGYSHAEIADLLNISEGTSKSQLSRARAMLQKQLNELESFESKIKI